MQLEWARERRQTGRETLGFLLFLLKQSVLFFSSLFVVRSVVDAPQRVFSFHGKKSLSLVMHWKIFLGYYVMWQSFQSKYSPKYCCCISHKFCSLFWNQSAKLTIQQRFVAGSSSSIDVFCVLNVTKNVEFTRSALVAPECRKKHGTRMFYFFSIQQNFVLLLPLVISCWLIFFENNNTDLLFSRYELCCQVNVQFVRDENNSTCGTVTFFHFSCFST